MATDEQKVVTTAATFLSAVANHATSSNVTSLDSCAEDCRFFMSWGTDLLKLTDLVINYGLSLTITCNNATVQNMEANKNCLSSNSVHIVVVIICDQPLFC